MDIEVSGSVDKQGIIDLIEKDANQDGYTIRQDSVVWNPEGSDDLVSFKLRGMTSEEKESKGLDPRPVPQQITQAITEVIRSEIRKLKHKINKKADSSAEIIEIPDKKSEPKTTDESNDETTPTKTETNDEPTNPADKIRAKRRQELEEANQYNQQKNLEEAGGTLTDGWDAIPEDKRND